MKVFAALQNDKGQVRIAFELSRNTLAIVKFFGDDTSFFTVKFWIGADPKNVIKHWSTQTPLSPEKSKVLISLAKSQLKAAYGYFKELEK